MINVETIKFLQLLNDLAEMTNLGYKCFEASTAEELKDFCGVIYSLDTYEAGTTLKGVDGYSIVADKCVDDQHKDVISTYGVYEEDYAVRYVCNEDGGDKYEHIEVTMLDGSNAIIFISDGSWRIESNI